MNVKASLNSSEDKNSVESFSGSPVKKFYIPPGISSKITFEVDNDSFSFNNKQKNIFNKMENFSCVKKETPKFSSISNQKSTPTENLMANFAAIRNQKRYKENLNKVLKNNDSFDKGGNFFARFTKNNINHNVLLKEELVKESFGQCLTRPSSISKKNLSYKKRLMSSKNLRQAKKPKILGQKHFEIFENNFLSKNSNSNLQSAKNINNIISKELSYTSKPSLNFQKPNPKINPIELDLNYFKPKTREIKSSTKKSKIKFSENRIKAQELSEDFKQDFLKGLKISFTGSKKLTDSNKISSKQNNLIDTLSKNKATSKIKEKKISLRYQSAKKLGNNFADENINTFNDYFKIEKESKLFQREMKNMMLSKKCSYTNKKSPIVPSFDYF